MGRRSAIPTNEDGFLVLREKRLTVHVIYVIDGVELEYCVCHNQYTCNRTWFILFPSQW